MDPVIARAREMEKLLYDLAKEGQISAPAYDGWDAKTQQDFVRIRMFAGWE